MSTSEQNVPRIIFMQMNAGIIEKYIIHYISTNVAHSCNSKVAIMMTFQCNYCKLFLWKCILYS